MNKPGYITTQELRDNLMADLCNYSPDHLDKLIIRVSDFMDSFIGYSLRKFERYENKRPIRITSNRAYIELSAKPVNNITKIQLHRESSDETSDISGYSKTPDEYLSVYTGYTISENDWFYIWYDAGYDTKDMPGDIKIACAYMCRNLLKMSSENGDSGIDALTSSVGSRLASFKNREYEEKYGNSDQEFMNEAQRMGAYKEIDYAFEILNMYRKIY